MLRLVSVLWRPVHGSFREAVLDPSFRTGSRLPTRRKRRAYYRCAGSPRERGYDEPIADRAHRSSATRTLPPAKNRATAGSVSFPLSLVERHRHEIADQRARRRIVQMHGPLEAGGRDEVALGMIRQRVDRTADALERGPRIPRVRREHANLALAIGAGPGNHTSAIGAELHREDPARHRRVIADVVEVVADLPRFRSVHLVQLRAAIGAADHQLVLGRMPIDRLQAPLERAGRNARDVVLEPFGCDFR